MFRHVPGCSMFRVLSTAGFRVMLKYLETKKAFPRYYIKFDVAVRLIQ